MHSVPTRRSSDLPSAIACALSLSCYLALLAFDRAADADFSVEDRFGALARPDFMNTGDRAGGHPCPGWNSYAARPQDVDQEQRRAEGTVEHRLHRRGAGGLARKSVVEGKGVSVRVDIGGRRISKKKKTKKKKK